MLQISDLKKNDKSDKINENQNDFDAGIDIPMQYRRYWYTFLQDSHLSYLLRRNVNVHFSIDVDV